MSPLASLQAFEDSDLQNYIGCSVRSEDEGL